MADSDSNVKPGLTIQGWGQISQLVSNLGAVGVLVWLVLVQMPNAQLKFHEELGVERGVFREELQATRTADQLRTQELTTAIRALAEEARERRTEEKDRPKPCGL